VNLLVIILRAFFPPDEMLDNWIFLFLAHLQQTILHKYHRRKLLFSVILQNDEKWKKRTSVSVLFAYNSLSIKMPYVLLRDCKNNPTAPFPTCGIFKVGFMATSKQIEKISSIFKKPMVNHRPGCSMLPPAIL